MIASIQTIGDTCHIEIQPERVIVTGFSGKYTRMLDHIVRHWLWWTIPMWDYHCDPMNPLTYTLDDGTRLTPDRNMLLSDGMSSPPFLWDIKGLAQTDFPMSVYFHDTGGRYGGYYVNGEFKLMTIDLLNQRLKDMVRSEGGTYWEAERIYIGVSIGMLLIVDPMLQAKNREQDGIVVTG